jgi:hypothetical protein
MMNLTKYLSILVLISGNLCLGQELPTAKISSVFIQVSEPEEKVIYVPAGEPIELKADESTLAKVFRWKVTPSYTPDGSPTYKSENTKGLGKTCIIYSRPGYYTVRLMVSNETGPDCIERRFLVYLPNDFKKDPSPFDPVNPAPTPKPPVKPTPKPEIVNPFDPGTPNPPKPDIPKPDIKPTPPIDPPVDPVSPLQLELKKVFGTSKDDALKVAAVLDQIAKVAIPDSEVRNTGDIIIIARGSLRKLQVDLSKYPLFEGILDRSFVKYKGKSSDTLTETQRKDLQDICTQISLEIEKAYPE